ncbi:MAG: nucleotidyltransferase domain-containing protein [Bacteroidota bacterium]
MIGLEVDTVCLNSGQYAVYSSICYFDVFNHPVKINEILEFASSKVSPESITVILNELLNLKLISEHDGFYFLDKVNSGLIKKRSGSEQRFHKKQRIIKWFAGFISRFPFVESVSISGSCSKGLLDEKGDVDYFIITSPQKVWLCRTILVAFKKIFLFNSKKYFCVNYFIDVDHLEIPDKNTFVASEIRTLVPVSNKALFEKFLEENAWTREFLPNKTHYNAFFLNEKKPKKYFFGFVEFILDNQLGEALDKWCFKLTLSSWEKKFPHFRREDFDLNMRSKKNVSKHHPHGHQQKVLFELNKKLEKIKLVA